VVNDNYDAADSLAAGFKQMGHYTRVVHDGAAALSAVVDFDPDMVLLDFGLPLVDGYEVARQSSRSSSSCPSGSATFISHAASGMVAPFSAQRLRCSLRPAPSVRPFLTT
jgi:CheY-like chemotaxis protein